jgi:hypothetical protein
VLHSPDEFFDRQGKEIRQGEVVEPGDLFDAFGAGRFGAALHFLVGRLSDVEEVGKVILSASTMIAKAKELDVEIGKGRSVHEVAFCLDESFCVGFMHDKYKL